MVWSDLQLTGSQPPQSGASQLSQLCSRFQNCEASAWAAHTHHILWEQRVHEVFAACICSQMHDGVYALTHSAAVVSRLEVKLHEGLVR